MKIDERHIVWNTNIDTEMNFPWYRYIYGAIYERYNWNVYSKFLLCIYKQQCRTFPYKIAFLACVWRKHMLQWFPLSIKYYCKPSHLEDFIIALRKKNIVHLWDARKIMIIHIIRAIFSGNFISLFKEETCFSHLKL